MLVIRLQRIGKKHQPMFRVVVGEKRRAPKGQYLESLGWYNPRTKERAINAERLAYWSGHGAQLSATARSLLKVARARK
ncbi:MAG: 30S ribosomal protein S16 [bacterium]|nr:30S ribosomal protein S16 [bacterium]